MWQFRQRRLQAPHVIPRITRVAKNDFLLPFTTVARLADQGVIVSGESVLVLVFQLPSLKVGDAHSAKRARVLLLQPLLDALAVEFVPARPKDAPPLLWSAQGLEADQALRVRSRFLGKGVLLRARGCPLPSTRSRCFGKVDRLKPKLFLAIHVVVLDLLLCLSRNSPRKLLPVPPVLPVHRHEHLALLGLPLAAPVARCHSLRFWRRRRHFVGSLPFRCRARGLSRRQPLLGHDWGDDDGRFPGGIFHLPPLLALLSTRKLFSTPLPPALVDELVPHFLELGVDDVSGDVHPAA
mmetsp:Transcript_12841/g.35969  ORF Transcript_12841/g.35969 Transcript_12841/m.35969 type:complete len:295 (-) Transcript_12841:448-1332(-)